MKIFVAYIIIFTSIFLHFQVSNAQKIMTPDVYSEWQKIVNPKIADDGNIVIYSLVTEIGDPQLIIHDHRDDSNTIFERAKKIVMSESGQIIAFTQNISIDSTKQLKRNKKPKDAFPKDSLVVYSTRTKSTTKIPNIENFYLPKKHASHVIYSLKKEVSTTKDSVKSEKKFTKASDCLNNILVIRNLTSNHEDTILYVKDFIVAEESPYLMYSTCIGDTVERMRVHVRHFENGLIFSSEETYFQVQNLALEKNGNSLAFLSLDKKYQEEQKPYNLHYKSNVDSILHKVNINNFDLKYKGFISPDQDIHWSNSGQKMYFGVSPLRPSRDTMILDEDLPFVEVWHQNSPRLFTQMKAELEKDKKQSFEHYIDLNNNNIIATQNPIFDKSMIGNKKDGDFILMLNSKPYQKEVTWNYKSGKDLMLFNTVSKDSFMIAQDVKSNPSFSPSGEKIVWWSYKDSIYHVFDAKNMIKHYLGYWHISNFKDELNDIPSEPNPYGIAGWLKGDSTVVVYDRYDLWLLHPNNALFSQNLTSGREDKKVFRWIQTDKEQEYIDPNMPILLHCFDEKSKTSSYHSLNINTGELKLLLNFDGHLTSNVIKAKNADTYIYTKETFLEFPDLHITSSQFQESKKISNANPQQEQYAWGTSKLFRWKTYKGKQLEGMVFFPPNFDSNKQYPLIVNFYERSSDRLHRHIAPEAHRSTINYTYYTNKGYIIFNPDIVYTTGQPGEDCLEAVESGVDALIDQGYIDPERMGLQGHSWGGYQVAYLLTKSNRYKCAESGAPVVNMVSAYGGIRWETGLSRMFQYEKTQSRLGVTLFEDPETYHKNSPIYEMDNVSTPVLIMHNDKDGHVPWYQGIEYFMALRRLNKPAWLLNYNDEPHWPLKWPNRLDFNIRMEQFFDHYLMNKPMPEWMKVGNTPLEVGKKLDY